MLCTGYKKVTKVKGTTVKLRCASGHEMNKAGGMVIGKHCVECGKPIVGEFKVEETEEVPANFNFSDENKEGDLEPVLIQIELAAGKTAYVSNVSDGTRESIDAEENSAKEMKDPAHYRDNFTKKLGKYVEILKKYHDKVELKVGIVVDWN